MGISAYHLLRKQHTDFFTRSFQIGLVCGLVGSLVVAIEGDLHAKDVTEKQPVKLAAMESLWETTRQAPIYLLAIPDEENGRNAVELLPVPGLLSFLGHGNFNAEVKGLNAIFPAASARRCCGPFWPSGAWWGWGPTLS
jgi:cytochrome d ubiquinol oxidase subunit I